jgi:hypothetical protein
MDGALVCAPGGELDVDANVLRRLGIPDTVLRDIARTKIDHVLAAICFSGTMLSQAGWWCFRP